jgi:hypothetical protein
MASSFLFAVSLMIALFKKVKRKTKKLERFWRNAVNAYEVAFFQKAFKRPPLLWDSHINHSIQGVPKQQRSEEHSNS